MRRHAPSPVLGATGRDEPACESKRGGHGLTARDAPAEPGAVRAHQESTGGITLDPQFCVDFGPDYGAHQIRLQGGDCSTDSFCYPSA